MSIKNDLDNTSNSKWLGINIDENQAFYLFVLTLFGVPFGIYNIFRYTLYFGSPAAGYEIIIAIVLEFMFFFLILSFAFYTLLKTFQILKRKENTNKNQSKWFGFIINENQNTILIVTSLLLLINFFFNILHDLNMVAYLFNEIYGFSTKTGVIFMYSFKIISSIILVLISFYTLIKLKIFYDKIRLYLILLSIIGILVSIFLYIIQSILSIIESIDFLYNQIGILNFCYGLINLVKGITIIIISAIIINVTLHGRNI